jgi:hypothetical protein
MSNSIVTSTLQNVTKGSNSWVELYVASQGMQRWLEFLDNAGYGLVVAKRTLPRGRRLTIDFRSILGKRRVEGALLVAKN